MKWWKNNRRLVIFLAVEVLTIIGAFHLIGRLLFLAIGLGVAYYIIKNYKTLKNTKAEDWLNPLKYASVAYAFFMKLLFPMHIVEQLITRMFDMQCRQCAKSGTCFNCKCDASKMYVPWEWCSLDNWAAMIEDPDEYKAIREEFPVEITVRYPREEMEQMIQGGKVFDYAGPLVVDADDDPSTHRSPVGLTQYDVRMNPLEEPMALWAPVYVDEDGFGRETISEMISRGMLRPSTYN